MRRCGTKTCFQMYAGEGNRRGVVLMLTVVVLVILATICYTLSARLSRLRRRQQYMIDYQKSRYACDSAMKLAMTIMKQVPLALAARQDEPDFSDVFMMDHEQFEQFKAEWAEIKTLEMAMEAEASGDGMPISEPPSLSEGLDPSDPNFFDPADMFMSDAEIIDPNSVEIPGPYGPQWPLVSEPIEFEMGDSTVTIRIEDENAKMPLTWAMTSNVRSNLLAEDAFVVFCEWMQMDISEIDALKEQVAEMGKYKQFSLSLKPIIYTEQAQTKTAARPTSTRLRTSGNRFSRTMRSTPTASRTVKKTRPAIAHATDFAKLLHSSLLDTDRLAWAIPNTGYRNESPLKYLALWGSQRVNINTAPRQVLEAAFTFGGNARDIAHEIILMRQEKPIASIDELKTKLYGYNESIRKVEPYITTTSKFFAVRVTARTGVARASSVATIIREGTNVQRIAVLSD